MNGLWAELPVFVTSLPEGWTLPSYLVLIIQVANIGPMLYTMLIRLYPHRVSEKRVVGGIIFVGILSCILLAHLWDHTTTISGREHSVLLFVLAGCLALVDTTSSVVYLPYLVIFKPSYISALYIGEGLSGFIPGTIGLLQGVSSDKHCTNRTDIYNDSVFSHTNHTYSNLTSSYDEPRFSVTSFIYILITLLIVSGASFVCLNTLSICKSEQMPVSTFEVSTEQDSDAQSLMSDPGDDAGGDSEMVPHFPGTSLIILLLIIVWVNALANGLMPSIQSYSCMPYGTTIYTLG